MEELVKDKEFRDFFMKLPISRLVVKVKPDGGFVYSEVNQAAADYFNIPRETMIGKTPAELFESSLKEQVEQSFKTCVATRRMLTVNIMPSAENRIHVQTFIINPIFDENNKVHMIDVMARPDTLSSNQLQRERDDALAQMTSIFDASGLGIVVTDHNARIVRLNETFLSDYGWDRNDLLGEEFSVLFPPEDYAFARKLHKNFIASGKRTTREMQFLKKEGSVSDVIVTMALMELSQNRKFMVATIRDITDRKKMMRKLEKAKEEADIANRSKSAFLANMSHELRTPLNAIIGFSELMQNEIFGPLNNEKYKEYMKDIHFSSRHLLEIINDVLDMSKIEAGKVELTESEIVVTDLFESVKRIMGDRAQAADIRLNFMVESDMPHIKADQRLLRQVLINLISNAIKFSSPGKDVYTKCHVVPGKGFRISVEDEGCGIPDEKIDIVQEPFGQVNDPRYSSAQGTGLGLPLAKAMIEMHKGTLKIESEVGKGTNLYLDFPEERIIYKKKK